MTLTTPPSAVTLNLRMAKRIISSIDESIMMLNRKLSFTGSLYTHVRFDTLQAAYDASEAIAEAVKVDALKLLNIRSILRDLVARANEDAGINTSISIIAKLSREVDYMRTLSGLTDSRRVDREATPVMSYFTSGVSSQYKENMITQSRQIQQRIQHEKDLCASLNSSTHIVLPLEVAAELSDLGVELPIR